MATGTTSQKILVIVSVILIVIGLALTFLGVFSPAWQIVEIREFQAEHQHGLWWDCIRGERHVVAVGDFYEESPLHCMYKMDSSADIVIENALNAIDRDGAVGESEHHKFWGWHKMVLFFAISSFFLSFVSIVTGICAPYFHPASFVFAISLFIALLFSLLADGIAFFSMKRVDIRFVQGMVGVYEQRIGYAFYLHFGGTICWMWASLCALVTTFKILTPGNTKREPHSSTMRLFESKSRESVRQPEISHVRMEWQPRSGSSNSTNISVQGPPLGLGSMTQV